MTNYPYKSVLVAAVSVGGLALSACAMPIWPSSTGQVHNHVETEHNRAVAEEQALHAKIASVDQVSQDAVARADAASASAKRPYQYQVLLQDDSVKFETNSAKLSPEAQARLTELAQKLQSEDRNVFVEIQGHGDIRGSEAHNRALGEKRADAVRRFLLDQGVPLPRMTTISYGKEKPKTGDQAKDAAAHAEDRRVVVVVLG